MCRKLFLLLLLGPVAPGSRKSSTSVQWKCLNCLASSSAVAVGWVNNGDPEESGLGVGVARRQQHRLKEGGAETRCCKC